MEITFIRPEDEGCYCEVNEILKDVIGTLYKSFDVVLIDGEQVLIRSTEGL